MRLVSYEMLDSRERGFGRIEGNSVIPMGLEPRPTGESTREAAAGSTRGSARGLQFRSDLKGFLASGGLGSVQVDAAEAGGAAGAGGTAGAGAAQQGDAIPLTEVELRAPIADPGKIVCVGLNYRDHAAESGIDVPDEPILFPKFANSVVGPEEAIVIPPADHRIDYEAELGVVIKSRAKGVSVEDALQYVAGYMCVNDVSARDLQMRTGQWMRGKAIDTFFPTGPWLVTKEDVPDPQDLWIRCRLNGKVMQDSRTDQMVFGVADLVSFISQTMTLEPGDIIATGTPPGVGFARDPAVWLQSGDRVTVEIEGLGVLSNPLQLGVDPGVEP